MSSGLTSGVYADREGEYESLSDGKVFLIGSAAFRDGAGGTTPRGQAAPVN